MNSVRIHYFSGTGNTARAVGLCKDHWEAAGWTTETRQIGPRSIPGMTEADDEVVAFPVLGFGAPSMVRKYIRRLPRGKGKPAAVLCTCAEGPAQALPQVERLLKRRGYTVNLTVSATYAHNWVQFFDTADPETMDAALAKGDKLTMEFARAFLSGEKRLARADRMTEVWSVPVAFLFGILGRRILGKAFVADETCTACGFCARTCPAGAIRLWSPGAKPLWKANCENCNRCMNLCPTRSIQTSNLRLKLHLGTSVVFTVGALAAGITAGFLAALPWAEGLLVGLGVALVGSIAFMALQLTLVDGLLAAFQNHWPRAFAKNFTAGFRRYRAPGFRVD